MAGGVVPEDWVAGCIDGHRRLETLLTTTLDDDVARQPSRLPGWSVGHVVTHIARNADGHTRVVEAAAAGDVALMYPGGAEGRAADIEAGSVRGAHELLADVTASQRRLESAWAALSHAAWAEGLGLRSGNKPSTVSDMAFLRWREVEVHHADLGLASPDHWDVLPPAYLDQEWRETTARLADRVPEGMTLVLVPGDRTSRAFGTGDKVVHVRGSGGRLLAWLLGRGGDPTWPALAPWS
jgi:maleylpyruvate isomerase